MEHDLVVHALGNPSHTYDVALEQVATNMTVSIPTIGSRSAEVVAPILVHVGAVAAGVLAATVAVLVMEGVAQADEPLQAVIV